MPAYDFSKVSTKDLVLASACRLRQNVEALSRLSSKATLSKLRDLPINLSSPIRAAYTSGYYCGDMEFDVKLAEEVNKRFSNSFNFEMDSIEDCRDQFTNMVFLALDGSDADFANKAIKKYVEFE